MSNCDNSIFLFEQLNNPKNNFKTCPGNVTRYMLLKELMCIDLEVIRGDLKSDKNMLWKLFYYNNRSSTSPFGFTFINGEIADPLQSRISTARSVKRATTTKQNVNASKKVTSRSRRNVVNNENKVTTQPSNKERRGFFNLFGKNNTRRVQRGRMFGGNALYDKNRNTYISLLNEVMNDPKQLLNEIMNDPEQLLNEGVIDREQLLNKLMIDQTKIFDKFRPMWRFGETGNACHTLSKLKPVDGLPIYVYGTSLPLPNKFEYPNSLGVEQYCTNTLLFYKYVKNISRIISLQGCGLNWNVISLPTDVKLPFRPRKCEDLDEKRIWDDICKSNDTRYDDTKSSIFEYYWIDMTSGFFDTYESIVSLDYTNPQLKTIVHCYAGYGRTGVTLLTILCKYFFSSANKKQKFNRLFNIPPNAIRDGRKQSRLCCDALMRILFNHIELDTLSDNTSGLNEDCIREINTSIEKFDINAITYEVFYGWASKINATTNQVSISLTALNTLITRLNYVIYFTAYVNNISQVNLYQLYRVDTITPHLQFITSDNLFEFPLLNPIQVQVKPFTRSLNNPNTSIYFGIDTIQPQPDFTVLPQTIYDHSDDPIGDERLSGIQDIPRPDKKISTTSFAKRQQQNNVDELHDVSF